MPFLFMSIFAWIAAVPGRADDDLPKPLQFDRYQKMVDRSPFALATAVVAAAATPNFAKDLYVANAARSPEGDMVTIASTADRNFKEYLTTKEPVDGYSIASIEWSEKVGETKVTISKDGQFATLSFNESLVAAPAQNVPQMVPAPPGAGVPPIPQPGFPKSPQMPAMPQRTPYVRGVIHRNPAAAPTPNVPVPPAPQEP